MSQLISVDFSSALSADFNGQTSVFSITGGTLTATGEGGILTKTSLGTGDKWMRFQIPVQGTSSGASGFSLGDSSGNSKTWILDRLSGGMLVVEYVTDYSTYTTWNSDTVMSSAVLGSLTAGNYIGVTFAPASNMVKVWTNVSAAEPDSVTSWDSSAADWTSTAITFKANSNYVGFLCWTSGGDGTNSRDNLTAGDFSAAGASILSPRHPMAHLLVR